MLFFVSPFVFFSLPCLVWCVATLLQPRFFTITTKHVCKAFLQEYRIRDIRFPVLWSKQDPNAKGEDEHERNRKKTGPQRRREKRPRKKYEKITRKKWEKKTGPPRASLKKTKNWKIKKNLEFFCVFFAFFLRFFCVFLAFFLRFFCVFFCVLFVVFFSSSQGSLFLCEASLATQIFDVISCGPGKLDLSRSMLKKGATQLFPISDPYPAGTKR